MLDRVRRSIRAHGKFARISGVIYALVIPVLAGVFAVYYKELSNVNPLLFWLPLVVFIIVAVLYAYFTIEMPLAAEIYVDLDQSVKTVNNLSSTIQYMSLLQGQILAWNSLTRSYGKGGIKNFDDLKIAISNFLDPIVEARHEYFGFERTELWNFAIYWWDTQRRLLMPIWRRKHPEHPSTDMGREWADGEGHVGHAFRNRRTLITPDGREQNVRAVLASLEKERPYDQDVYRSYVSQPINAAGNSAMPYGVLVVTSNRPGRFDEANGLVLLHASAALAAAVQLTYDSGAC